MDNVMHPITTQGIDLPVGEARSSNDNRSGIAIATHNSRVLISIVKNGKGLCVWLSDDEIDLVAGMLAVAIETVNRAEAPSLGSAH